MFDLCDAHIARACWSNRQVLEVMVDFWSNHLNVTCPSSDVWGTRHLYDANVIRKHALGRYSDMLVASARHPAMLAYLDNASSEKDAPNENYARELLELHTVGVGAGYTEAMVRVGGAAADRAVDRRPVDDLPLRHVQARDRRGEGARLHRTPTARRTARRPPSSTSATSPATRRPPGGSPASSRSGSSATTRRPRW